MPVAEPVVGYVVLARVHVTRAEGQRHGEGARWWREAPTDEEDKEGEEDEREGERESEGERGRKRETEGRADGGRERERTFVANKGGATEQAEANKNEREGR